MAIGGEFEVFGCVGVGEAWEAGGKGCVFDKDNSRVVWVVVEDEIPPLSIFEVWVGQGGGCFVGDGKTAFMDCKEGLVVEVGIEGEFAAGAG